MTPEELHPFQSYPKMARLSRECVITEKLDGTNAQVYISDDGEIMCFGSRTRWLTPGADNFGFYAWCDANRDELRKLGPGRHFGEWWGPGIQRGYGQRERRFSLFDVSRWEDDAVRPACCFVVPVLYRGVFSTGEVDAALERLRAEGSLASPGFLRPEGVVVWHLAAGVRFKKTLEKDDEPKGRHEG